MIVGNVAAVYLKGTPPGAPACATNALGVSLDQPGYFEFAMLHEIVHSLGFAATCATNQTLSGHVSDSPTDLLWTVHALWCSNRLRPAADL